MGISKSTYLHPSDMEQIQATQTPRLFSAMDPGFRKQTRSNSQRKHRAKKKTSLVGGIPTPLKNMTVSWDDYSQLNGKKNVPKHQPLISIYHMVA